MWIVLLVVLAFIAGWCVGRMHLGLQMYAIKHNVTMRQMFNGEARAQEQAAHADTASASSNGLSTLEIG
jgi:hypothetical protein